ncbi:MAG TPA: amidase, partial [Acetobacteraceae bacterium]|nr:amidase [Acetobacteraceae bacterium]
MTVDDIGAGYDCGDFSPTDVVSACIERIASLEPFLNAFIAINSRMLEDAALMDAEIAAGGRRGPLHGVPVIIKDNMNQTGFRTTAGYAGFASDDRVVDPTIGTFNGIDLVPQADATLVARLKAAGAVIVGKSNLPDFGLDGLRADSSHNGDTLNPYGASFAPGASSTGSATGVSAGFAPVAIGTDTAGSILFPASAQSLVGIKPSFGLVPTDGIFPGLSSHHDVAGPIAKTVRDAATVLEIIAAAPPNADGRGYVQALRKGALQGKVLGLFEPGEWAVDLHPEIADHYQRMIRVVESLGARTVNVVFSDTDFKEAWDARVFFAGCNSYLAGVDEFLTGLGGANPASRKAFAERAGFEIGLATTAPLYALLANPAINVAPDAPELAAVIDQANRLYDEYQSILNAKSIDALFVPRSVAPLPDLSGNTLQYLGDQVSGTQVNEMGLPVITVPAGQL